jgi:hypothetical protein
MQQQHQPDESVVCIVRQLGSRKREAQEAAKQTIGQMGPEAVEELLRVLESEARRWESRRRRRVVWLTLMAAASVAVPWLIFGLPYGEVMRTVAGLFQMAFGLLGFSTVIWLTRPSRRQKKAAAALAECEDLRVVGPLAQTLAYEDRKVQNVAVSALTRLLPRLRASDADLLDDKQRTRLYNALDWGTPSYEADFLIAILKALEQVGDEKALRCVENRAALEPQDADGRRVQKAATACLPHLRERIEQERVAAILLRPAIAPADLGATLLRPAQGVGDTDSTLLLRPVAEDDAVTG